MKVIVTGAKGLLGSCLSDKLEESGISVIRADLPEYNIISYPSVSKLFTADEKIDFLINCAAYTDVPKAEEDKQSAYFLNAQSCGVLSKICLENNVHLIHFSTDFVFDGKKDTPYEESDNTNPLNYYGESKLAGENIIQRNPVKSSIFRLQWLFGKSQKTFFSKILEKSKTDSTLKIVQDEVGSPCSVTFVSNTILKVITSKDLSLFNKKIYHLTHNNYCSRYECARYFLESINWGGSLVPALTSDFPSNVLRPKFGALSNQRLSSDLGIDLGTWESDIDSFLAEIKNVK